MSYTHILYESPASRCVRFMEQMLQKHAELFKRPVRLNGAPRETEARRIIRRHEAQKKAHAIEYAKNGYNCAEIGAKLGISRHTVLHWVRDAGVGSAKLEYSEDTRLKAVQMAKEGKRNIDISNALGVSTATVHRWTKDVCASQNTP